MAKKWLPFTGQLCRLWSFRVTGQLLLVTRIFLTLVSLHKGLFWHRKQGTNFLRRPST